MSSVCGQHHVGVRQQTVGAHQHRLFQAGDFQGLLGDEVASGLEDREEDELRTGGSDFGQHRAHVGLIGRHRRAEDDRPAKLLERCLEGAVRPWV